MSEEVKNFIDKIADGDNTAAGDAFKDALRVKVGDALDAHRQEVAGNLFNGNWNNHIVIQNQKLLILVHLTKMVLYHLLQVMMVKRK
jgi:hypothetical protein